MAFHRYCPYTTSIKATERGSAKNRLQCHLSVDSVVRTTAAGAGFSRDYTWVDESQPLTMWQKCLDPATVTQMLAAEEVRNTAHVHRVNILSSTSSNLTMSSRRMMWMV